MANSWEEEGGKKRAKTKQRTINVSCIFQKIGKALPGPGIARIASSCPAISDAEKETLATQRRLWQHSFLSLSLPPNCQWLQQQPDFIPKVPLVSQGCRIHSPCCVHCCYCLAWAQHCLCGRLLGLSAQISLLCTRWGAFKVPSLSLQSHRDMISGLKPCLVHVCSSETPPKKWLLMQDNESALEPIVSVSKQKVLKHRQSLNTLTQ